MALESGDVETKCILVGVNASTYQRPNNRQHVFPIWLPEELLYRIVVASTTLSLPRLRPVSPRGPTLLYTANLGRLNLTEGALKLRLDIG